MSTELFSIHSTKSDHELAFRSYRGEQYQVELKGSGFSVLTDVWAGDLLYPQDLSNFFRQLANFTKPWNGSQDWESLEGELALSVTCTTLGQVNFQVEISQRTGASEAWSVRVGIETELGQLEKLAREAKLFFQEKGT